MDKKIIFVCFFITAAFVFIAGCAENGNDKNSTADGLSEPEPVNSYDAKYYFTLGYGEYENENYDRSMEYFSKAIELNENYTDAYVAKGLALISKQDYIEALTNFDKAISLNPGYLNAWVGKAVSLEKLNRTGDAERLYFSLGFKEIENKNYNESLKYINKAIELNPKNYDAYNVRGTVYGEKQQYDSAVRDFSRAIELNENYSEAYGNRGFTLFLMQEYDRALPDFDKAVELNPTYSKAWLGKAAVLEKLNRTDEALNAYKKVVELSG